ncbi:hypothetical protein EPO15_14755 [bacterium]|nr:MAG: hypothetical protein EPO15_14755 [bacterium]
MGIKAVFRTRGDWRLEDSPEGPRIVVPTRPVWPVAVFLGLWLAGWTAGEVSALQTVFGRGHWFDKGFILFWLCGWTVGGAFAWAIFLATSGLARETLWREGPDFCARWSVLGLGWTFRYAVAAMGPLAAPEPKARSGPALPAGALVVADGGEPLRPRALGTVSGADYAGGAESDGIRFRHAGKESAVAKGLDEGQAARLAEVLALRFGLRLGTGPSGV